MSKKKRRRPSQRSARRQKSSSLIIPIVVGIVVVAILAGAILSLELGRTASAELPGDGLSGPSTAQGLNTASLPYPDVPRVSLEDAQDKLAQDQAILVDVRSRESYDKSHAAGAISMPEAEITAHLDELPRDKDIILYCTWGQEQQSARVAQTLISRGFDNVQALLGGFAAWQRAGLALEPAVPWTR